MSVDKGSLRITLDRFILPAHPYNVGSRLYITQTYPIKRPGVPMCSLVLRREYIESRPPT